MEGGANLAQILSAGQWRSSAFLKYLKEADLEMGAAIEIAIDSEGEEWLD